MGSLTEFLSIIESFESNQRHRELLKYPVSHVLGLKNMGANLSDTRREPDTVSDVPRDPSWIPQTVSPQDLVPALPEQSKRCRLPWHSGSVPHGDDPLKARFAGCTSYGLLGEPSFKPIYYPDLQLIIKVFFIFHGRLEPVHIYRRFFHVDQVQFGFKFLGQAESVLKCQIGILRKITPHQDFWKVYGLIRKDI